MNRTDTEPNRTMLRAAPAPLAIGWSASRERRPGHRPRTRLSGAPLGLTHNAPTRHGDGHLTRQQQFVGTWMDTHKSHNDTARLTAARRTRRHTHTHTHTTHFGLRTHTLVFTHLDYAQAWLPSRSTTQPQRLASDSYFGSCSGSVGTQVQNRVREAPRPHGSSRAIAFIHAHASRLPRRVALPR